MTAITKRGDKEVRQFADAMLHQLKLNEAKGDWEGQPLDDSIWQVLYHFVKLALAAKAQEVDPVAVQEYAADVGNEAMILADNLKALDQTYQSGSHSIEKGGAMEITERIEQVLIKAHILPKGFEVPPVTPAQGGVAQQLAEALAAKLDPKERALRMIQESRNWKPGDPSKVSEGGPQEKARMIARWGLEGDEEMLDKAEVALGLKDV